MLVIFSLELCPFTNEAAVLHGTQQHTGTLSIGKCQYRDTLGLKA